VLLKQWLPEADYRAWIHALRYARPKNLFPSAAGCLSNNMCFGKCFPALMTALSGLLNRAPPRFQKVELLVLAQPWQMEKTCLGPHCRCQCGTGFVFAWVGHVAKGRRLHVKVPSWVVESGPTAVKPQSVGLAPVRFQWCDTERIPVGDSALCAILSCCDKSPNHAGTVQNL
jgi:hypothetical protein